MMVIMMMMMIDDDAIYWTQGIVRGWDEFASWPDGSNEPLVVAFCREMQSLLGPSAKSGTRPWSTPLKVPV